MHEKRHKCTLIWAPVHTQLLSARLGAACRLAPLHRAGVHERAKLTCSRGSGWGAGSRQLSGCSRRGGCGSALACWCPVKTGRGCRACSEGEGRCSGKAEPSGYRTKHQRLLVSFKVLHQGGEGRAAGESSKQQERHIGKSMNISIMWLQSRHVDLPGTWAMSMLNSQYYCMLLSGCSNTLHRLHVQQSMVELCHVANVSGLACSLAHSLSHSLTH